MLSGFDAVLLRLSCGYIRARPFDDHLRQCHEIYRTFYGEIDAKHPPVVWEGSKNPDFETDWRQMAEAHEAKIAARTLAIKTEVAAAINALGSRSLTYQAVKKVLHPVLREYWIDNARHHWRAYQVEGGMIDLGMRTKQDALDALGRAAKEVNVINVDDHGHFIFFRTPDNKG